MVATVADKHAARVHQAVVAAQSVARRHGIASHRLGVLHDANNVVVHLAPSPVVAKIALSSQAGGWHRLAAELEVARHLAQAGAPVVGPSSDLSPGPHASGDYTITFWRYYAHDPRAAVCTKAAGETLAQIHRALDGYSSPLGSFLERRVRRTGEVLADPAAQTSLPAADRTLLLRAYVSIMSSLEQRTLDSRALHGDPHRGNLLVGSDGYAMIDFESVCSGPLEWDLSALPGHGAGVFDVDEELLMLLGSLRSVCIAVWCARRAARSNEMEKAARLHLDLLRSAA